jgi:hypothetical protein
MRSVSENLSNVQKDAVSILENMTKDAFVDGLVFNNFDHDQVTGYSMLLKGNAKAHPELVKKDAFKYVSVVPIDLSINPQINGDKYFLERKDALNETIPQYGKDARPSLEFRDRKTNNDKIVTDVELGQYDGRVGIYKSIDEDGDHGNEQTSYYLVACGGAEKACKDLQKHIETNLESIENWENGYTYNDLKLSPEYGYVKDVCATNVTRMLNHAAADAFEIEIPTAKYYNVNLNLNKHAYPLQAMVETLQPINTIMDSSDNVVVYKDTIPSDFIKKNRPLYVLEGPADPIYRFNSGLTHLKHGFPASTGRKVPLPENISQIKSEIAQNKTYIERNKKVFFEGSNPHPDLISGSFNKVATKHDRTFLDNLQKLGWSEKDNFFEKLIPVCVKISNPFLLPPAAQSMISKKNTNPVDEEEDEF